jgi:hypothetical protein
VATIQYIASGIIPAYLIGRVERQSRRRILPDSALGFFPQNQDNWDKENNGNEEINDRFPEAKPTFFS